MRKTRTIIITAAIALLGIGAAQAAPAGPPAFAWFDSDGDGRISQQEFSAGHARRIQQRLAQGHRLRHAHRHPEFVRLDLDRDAGLSPEELAQARPARWGRRPPVAEPSCPRRGF